MRSLAILTAALGALVFCAPAIALEISASGNPASDGFGYTPADATAAVGETVRWSDSDLVAPHDAVEASELWRTDVIDPGAAAERVFEAGTFEYFCSIHGAAKMSGVIRVAPSVAAPGGGRVQVRWAAGAPRHGQVFDVQRRKAGSWKLVLDGTTKAARRFRGSGRFRARLRERSDVSTASGWSPAGSASGR